MYFPQSPWEWKPGAHLQEGDGILSLRGPSVSPSGSCRAKGNAAEVNYQPPPSLPGMGPLCPSEAVEGLPFTSMMEPRVSN